MPSINGVTSRESAAALNEVDVAPLPRSLLIRDLGTFHNPCLLLNHAQRHLVERSPFLGEEMSLARKCILMD